MFVQAIKSFLCNKTDFYADLWVHLSLSFQFYSAETVTNITVSMVTYQTFLFPKSLPVAVKFISAAILCNTVHIYSFI